MNLDDWNSGTLKMGGGHASPCELKRVPNENSYLFCLRVSRSVHHCRSQRPERLAIAWMRFDRIQRLCFLPLVYTRDLTVRSRRFCSSSFCPPFFLFVLFIDFFFFYSIDSVFSSGPRQSRMSSGNLLFSFLAAWPGQEHQQIPLGFGKCDGLGQFTNW